MLHGRDTLTFLWYIFVMSSLPCSQTGGSRLLSLICYFQRNKEPFLFFSVQWSSEGLMALFHVYLIKIFALVIDWFVSSQALNLTQSWLFTARSTFTNSVVYSLDLVIALGAIFGNSWDGALVCSSILQKHFRAMMFPAAGWHDSDGEGLQKYLRLESWIFS